MKIGVMNDPANSVYDEVVSFGEAGYNFVDLTIEPPKALDVNVDRLRSILDRYDMFVVGHTDPCLPYAYPLPTVRDACLRELERCARTFSALGARIMNIHPCYASPPGMKPNLVEMNTEALRSVVAMADSYGLAVVLENYLSPFDRASTFTKLTETVAGLQMHLDVGHANLGKDQGDAFCQKLRHHIRHVHVSDNRSKADDHMPLGSGNIDWTKIVQALKMIGYDETITLEVFGRDPRTLFKYLDVSRNFLLDLWSQY
jgi:sugar phosphate isomerase/epimerase